ncbi:MAG: hypothetical protein LBM87_02850 [Ruminococcus sp.]|jgi:hypothetical protein|nr:hypothetical protein [Ruminococcus sp.]
MNGIPQRGEHDEITKRLPSRNNRRVARRWTFPKAFLVFVSISAVLFCGLFVFDRIMSSDDPDIAAFGMGIIFTITPLIPVVIIVGGTAFLIRENISKKKSGQNFGYNTEGSFNPYDNLKTVIHKNDIK